MDRVFFFLLWPKCEVRGPWKQGRKKRGSITCRTDRANKANKMFIIWLCWLFRFWKGDQELEVRTATYGPGIDQSQHAKSVSHIIKNNIVHMKLQQCMQALVTLGWRLKYLFLFYMWLVISVSWMRAFIFRCSNLSMGNARPLQPWWSC